MLRPRRPTPGTGHAAQRAPGGSSNALPASTRLGNFELQRVLGEGGFGIVYLAWDRQLERHVAVKEYMPTTLAVRNGNTRVEVRSRRHAETFELGLRSFVNEAKLLARFDHPSLVKVHHFWEENGTAYMAMPFYEGVTLGERLRQMAAPPDEDWLLALLDPLTQALGVLHGHDCFHRDIAPDNIILLSGSNRPVLLDFGAARHVIGGMAQSLTVILKPGYAPVEQYAEAAGMQQGPWTDVYALAATVYHAIRGTTPPPAVARLVDDACVPLREAAAGRYSPRFLQAMDQALRVQPQERLPDVAALRQALGLEDEGTPTPRAAPAAGAPDADPAQRAPLRTRRRRGLVALLVGAGGAAGLGAYLWRAAGPAGGPGPPGRDAGSPSPSPASTSPAPPAALPAPAASAVPSPPPAPAAAPRFEVQREFDKVLAAQTPGFDVRASSARQQLRIGRDHLRLTVTSQRDGYLSVWVAGPDGALLLLFPNSKAGRNRIAAGQALTLPQSDWMLETTPPAGQERFLVVVSDQPRDYGALAGERAYWFLKLPTGDAASAQLARWPHATPLLLGTARGCAGRSCDDFGATQLSVEVVER